jgi:hypothetical protein
MFTGAPTVKVGSQNGRLVTTKLFSAILLDDGHLVIGALTPDALVAAAATPAS